MEKNIFIKFDKDTN